VHPFWLSHEEKRAWLRLSMGGQPWPELELHGRPSGVRRRGKRGGRGRERGGTELNNNNGENNGENYQNVNALPPPLPTLEQVLAMQVQMLQTMQ
jgi:hypothetical protein